MSSHIGETVRIADLYTRGLTNGHVSVQRTTDGQAGNKLYTVYAREQYNLGRGPRPMPTGREDMFNHDLLQQGEKPRGWGHIDTLCQNANLDEAMKVAKPEASRRGVVLYLDDVSIEIK